MKEFSNSFHIFKGFKGINNVWEVNVVIFFFFFFFNFSN